jgi:Flp pilus assembly protein CpaB
MRRGARALSERKEKKVESAQKLVGSRRGTIILSIIAGLVAAALVIVYVNRYRHSVAGNAQPVTVLVAKGPIYKGASGDVIAAEGLYTTTTLRQGQVLSGAFSDPSSLRGQAATTDIAAGSQLTAGDFARASSNPAASITGNQRIVSIPMAGANGLSGVLQAGDHVDVYVGFNVVPVNRNGVAVSGGQSRPVVKRILSDVTVVGQGGKTSGILSTGNGDISFKVTDDQAAELQFASQNGTLWLALRPSAGAKSSPPSITSMETLLLGVSPRVVLRSLGARG